MLPTYLRPVDQISDRMRGMAQRFDALTRRIEALEAAAARDQQPDPPVHDPQVHSVDAATGRPITRSSGGYAGLRQGWHTGVSEHNPGSPDAMLQRVADRLEASMAVMAHSLDVESEEEWDQLVSVFCEMSVATFEPLVDESHRLGREHESPSETTSGQEFWDGSALPTPGAPT